MSRDDVTTRTGNRDGTRTTKINQDVHKRTHSATQRLTKPASFPSVESGQYLHVFQCVDNVSITVAVPAAVFLSRGGDGAFVTAAVTSHQRWRE